MPQSHNSHINMVDTEELKKFTLSTLIRKCKTPAEVEAFSLIHDLAKSNELQAESRKKANSILHKKMIELI